MRDGQKIGQKFRNHDAPCGLPCLLESERGRGQLSHVITEECLRCQSRMRGSKIYVDGKVYDKEDDPRKNHQPTMKPVKTPTPPLPPEPKVPWERIVIPPHALKMVKIRAGFISVVDAAIMIERLYPLTVYNSSQKEAKGTSHTRRTKPGKNKKKSQRVDLYTVTDEGVEWIFYMKRNVLMTVHRNDEFDHGFPYVDNEAMTSNG
jgi:hypothetical protein